MIKVTITCLYTKQWGYQQKFTAEHDDGTPARLSEASKALTGVASQDANGVFNLCGDEFHAFGTSHVLDWEPLDEGRPDASEVKARIIIRAADVQTWVREFEERASSVELICEI